MTETITAAFDDSVEAENVMNDLLAIGCCREDINLFVPDQRDGPGLHSELQTRVQTGVFHVTVTVPASLVEKVMGVIHEHGSFRIEGPNFQWRRRGWGHSYPF